MTIKRSKESNHRSNSALFGLALATVLAVPAVSQAVTVNLTASDGFGDSSFDSSAPQNDSNVPNWGNGAFPTAGNDYVVDGSYRLRTPADGGVYTFAGDSLTIQNSGAANSQFGLSFKGAGSSGSITINNLILGTGGQINAINGGNDVFNLYGNLNIAGDSSLYAKQGPINIYSDIGGSAQITIPASDVSGDELSFLSSANTFKGNIINNGRFTLGTGANLNFVIGSSGVNNNFSDGAGQQHAIFDGDFVFDLSGASTTFGDSWQVIDTASATYFGSTFGVQGFTDQGSGIWTGSANGAEYQFDTAGGTLSVVPEPASATLLVAGALGLMAVARRKTR